MVDEFYEWLDRIDPRGRSFSVVFLAVLGQVLLPILPLVNLATLNFQNTLQRSLQFPVLLELTVAIQFHFLALAGSYSRSFQRDLLSSKNYITRLLPSAHTAGRRIGSMRRSYPCVTSFSRVAQDLQPGLPGPRARVREDKVGMLPSSEFD